MATRKKSSTRAKKKASGAIKGLPKTKKFSGKTYTKSSCSRLKSDAKKKAENLRKRGKSARVVTNPKGGHCVFTRGSFKKKAS